VRHRTNHRVDAVVIGHRGEGLVTSYARRQPLDGHSGFIDHAARILHEQDPSRTITPYMSRVCTWPRRCLRYRHRLVLAARLNADGVSDQDEVHRYRAVRSSLVAPGS
jgi:hypothetical protein